MRNLVASAGENLEFVVVAGSDESLKWRTGLPTRITTEMWQICQHFVMEVTRFKDDIS
jgi:hypothetical protein